MFNIRISRHAAQRALTPDRGWQFATPEQLEAAVEAAVRDGVYGEGNGDLPWYSYTDEYLTIKVKVARHMEGGRARFVCVTSLVS
jgi:hypothetical protein